MDISKTGKEARKRAMVTTMFEQIKAILADELGLDPSQITPDAGLTSDLGVGSLEFVNAILTLEDAFHVTTDEDRLKQLKTVSDLVAYMEELTKA